SSMTRVRTTLSLLLAASALAGASVLVPATASAAVVAAVQPTRVLDTRNGIGGTSGMVSPGAVVRVAIAPAASAGASAVVLNLTATNGDSAGWVKAWPCSDPTPETSVVNFPANRTAANAVILKYDSAGVCMSTSSPVHLVADLTGWFVGQSDFTGTVPGRILDTRTSGDPLEADVERRVTVAGREGINAQATFVALNLTVVGPGTAGWLVAYPCGQPSTSSTVTFSAFETVANLSLVGLGQGDVCVRASTDVALVVDSYGYSTGQGGLRVASPSRLLDTRNTSQWPTGAAEAGDIINLRVAGRGGVPNDADSVVVTVTIIDPTTDGFVTAWPCDQPAPTTSTINTWPGARRSNLGLVKTAVTAGTICIRYQSSQYNARTNIVVDAVGWSTGGPARTAPTGVGTLTPAPEPPPVGLPPMGTVLWSEDFSSPTGMNRLVKHISFGDNVVNGAPMQTFNGDHDHNCGSPATTRRLVENYQVSTHFWY
ncbi:MAG: hypothetical protein Q7V62_11425, partial [Actinomycetota bacterium]|nr:hypothetical protein [Actinomycetota bacterium]